MTDLHDPAQPADPQPITVYPVKEAMLGGGLKIRRALPNRHKRMIGAWCFLDHFGPLDFTGKAMDVAPHPHIGLQTVTWLLEGEIHHKDSLGFNQVIRPGALNLMTAGKGIAHSEETPPENSGRVHGVQFWIALPDRDRDCEPDFQHVPEAPRLSLGALDIQVFLGEALGLKAEPKVYSPMTGFDVTVGAAGTHQFALNPEWEYGLVPVGGSLTAGDVTMTVGNLYDLGRRRDHFSFSAAAGTRFVVVGGRPFEENILLWWNFVARTTAEIDEARRQWEQGERFGPVNDYDGDRLTAPPLNVNLK